jgi:hypothetical protein
MRYDLMMSRRKSLPAMIEGNDIDACCKQIHDAVKTRSSARIVTDYATDQIDVHRELPDGRLERIATYMAV